MSMLQRLARQLVDSLGAHAPAALGAPVALDDILQRVLPYRACRRLLGILSVEEYEVLLMRLVAGEGGLAMAMPPAAAERCRAELDTGHPDPRVLQGLEGVALRLNLGAIAVGALVEDDEPGQIVRSYALAEPEGGAETAAPSAEPPEAVVEGTEDPGPPVAAEEPVSMPADEPAGPVAPDESEPPIETAPEPFRPARPDAEETLPEPTATAEERVSPAPPLAPVRPTPEPEHAAEIVPEPPVHPEAAPDFVPEVTAAATAPPASTAPPTDSTPAGEPDEPPPAPRTEAPPSPGQSPEPPPRCPHCASRLPAGRPVRFCPHCGSNVVPLQCARCGADLEPAWRHCVLCGAPAVHDSRFA